MAACLITVTGTSGVIRINYTISGTPYTIETSIGSFYIDDTATDVTYTTLSGDLIAADSGCLTPAIADLPASCYLVSWSEISAPGYIIDRVYLGYETGGFTIADTPFPNSLYNLVDSINNADDDSVKVIGIKTSWNNTLENFSCAYLLKVLGNQPPNLRVRNADSTQEIYIHGVLQADCLPITGFTIVDPCYSSLPPAP